MDNQTPEDPFRLLARERSHEDARQTVATNRMPSLAFRKSGKLGGLETGYGAVIFLPKLKTKLLLVLFCLLAFCSASFQDFVRLERLILQ